MEFFILCSLTPPQAAGNALAGIQLDAADEMEILNDETFSIILFPLN
jgi:hypothetical protein